MFATILYNLFNWKHVSLLVNLVLSDNEATHSVNHCGNWFLIPKVLLLLIHGEIVPNQLLWFRALCGCLSWSSNTISWETCFWLVFTELFGLELLILITRFIKRLIAHFLVIAMLTFLWLLRKLDLGYIRFISSAFDIYLLGFCLISVKSNH